MGKALTGELSCPVTGLVFYMMGINIKDPDCMTLAPTKLICWFPENLLSDVYSLGEKELNMNENGKCDQATALDT